MNDWQAVADLTGMEKLHGAQGPAPTIPEMTQALRAALDRKVVEAGQPDLVGFGIESLVATLLVRAR